MYKKIELSALPARTTASLAQCALELVINSLNARATSIAIRVDMKNRKIEVVDNGRGMSRSELQILGEYDNKPINDDNGATYVRKKSLVNIRRLAGIVKITSRECNSKETYSKIFKFGIKPELIDADFRPSNGTTVTVYDFYKLPIKYDRQEVALICLLVAVIALVEPTISFSIRDDEHANILVRIGKPHSAVNVLSLLFGEKMLSDYVWLIKSALNSSVNYIGYIGLINSKSSAIKQIFLNYRPVDCPVVLQWIINFFMEGLAAHPRIKTINGINREMIFVLFFINLPSTDYTLTYDNGKARVMFRRVQNILSNVKNCIINAVMKDISPAKTIPQLGLKKSTNLTNNVSTKSTFGSAKIENEIGGLIASAKENLRITGSVSVTKQGEIRITYTVPMNSKNSRKEECDNNFHNKITALDNEKISNYDWAFSEWSDFHFDSQNLYSPVASHENEIIMVNGKAIHSYPGNSRRFEFIPQKLRKNLLDCKNIKLKNINNLNGSDISANFNVIQYMRREEAEVRFCGLSQPVYEFKLRRETLNFVKILRQVNNEFIAALTIQDNKKILLLMDQHAVHERIRYENLLDKYRTDDRSEFLSVHLRYPMIIELTENVRSLLTSHKALLKKFGLKIAALNDIGVAIHEIPKCFVKSNKYNCDDTKMKSAVLNLLSEIAEKLVKANVVNNVPNTIHNAIAMEACRGAIKFGDPLTVEQCTSLLNLLEKTRCPTQCAHGRPSIVPILDYTEFTKRREIVIKEKLNFSSLMSRFKKCPRVQVHEYQE